MIAYYITAHGYGHGVRSCEIITALLGLAPGSVGVVVSGLPRALLAPRLPLPLADRGSPEDGARLLHRSVELDVGMVQRDSVRLDAEATLERLTALVGAWDARVDEEARFLDAIGATSVVADIPGIPLEAAARSGRPALAVGNFSWNWIYEPYADGDGRWSPAVDCFARAYARSDLLLRLPFAEPMSAFLRQETIPLLSEPGRSRRRELAEWTGADPARPWALLSFTTLDWNRDAVERVAGGEFELFTVRPLAWDHPRFHALDPHAIPFRDALASCDAVVSKPGYGIVSECIVNRKPIVHAVRAGFREYPILREAIEAHLPNIPLSEEDLYAGRIGPALERLRSVPDPGRTMETGGAARAAERILSQIPSSPLPPAAGLEC